jgi:hypothetical protein
MKPNLMMFHVGMHAVATKAKEEAAQAIMAGGGLLSGI